jgi:DNA-binding transcriptional regulator YhcF (GntR family)
VTLKIRINRKSVESMTRQITDQLGGLIGSGAMAVGSVLPSERSLANSLGVARNVVRGSYEYLEKAGVVQREGRKGRRVRAKTSRAKTTTNTTKTKTAKKSTKKR